MLEFLFRPIQHLGLRILIFFCSLVLFMTGGAYVASWMTGPVASDGWLTAISMMLAGGLLLFKARSPGKRSQ